MAKSIVILLLFVSWRCQSFGFVNNDVDSTVYRFRFFNGKDFFISPKDTIWFSKLIDANDRPNSPKFSNINIGNKAFIVFYSVTLSYSIQRKLESPSFVDYLDLPYGQLSIDEGVYSAPEIIRNNAHSDQHIKSTVIINKQPNKDEKKFTKGDWKKANKRRKEPINFLEIVDTENKTVYASASRAVNTKGEILYAVKISDQCPEKSKILFKSALFMVLWLYHKDKN